MSIGINVKINDTIYKEASRYFGKGRGKLNRNAFINQAIAFFVRVHDRHKQSAEFKRASLADQKDPSLQIELREWEQAALSDLDKMHHRSHEAR